MAPSTRLMGKRVVAEEKLRKRQAGIAKRKATKSGRKSSAAKSPCVIEGDSRIAALESKLLTACLVETLGFLDNQSIRSCQFVSRRWSRVVERNRYSLSVFSSETCSLVGRDFLFIS